jgi:hypothetical protein
MIALEQREYLMEALKSLSDAELDIAIFILTGEVTTAEYARQKGMKRTTVCDQKKAVLHKLQQVFKKKGFEIEK